MTKQIYRILLTWPYITRWCLKDDKQQTIDHTKYSKIFLRSLKIRRGTHWMDRLGWTVEWRIWRQEVLLWSKIQSILSLIDVSSKIKIERPIHLLKRENEDWTVWCEWPTSTRTCIPWILYSFTYSNIFWILQSPFIFPINVIFKKRGWLREQGSKLQSK